MVFYGQQKSGQSSAKNTKVIFRILFRVGNLNKKTRELLQCYCSVVSFVNSEQVSDILRVVFVDAMHVFVCWVKYSCLTCFMPMTPS